MRFKIKDPNTGETIEDEIVNPYPYGSAMYKEFEKDLKRLSCLEQLSKRDKYGNPIIYKTSVRQRAVMILLLYILFVLLAS